MSTVSDLVKAVSRLLAPPPTITLSQWADQHFVLSPEYAAEPGKWTTLPYQREPMDAVSDPRVRRVVIKSATQMLKSVVIQTGIGYFADVDPGPMLLVLPGDKDAKDFSKERIAPMIRDTPRLRAIFRESKRASSDGTITEKLFRGGMLAIAGGGSPRNVARRTIRILWCDEIDKYKPTVEGNVLGLARKRQAWFRHRAKEVDTCSPTVPGSEIDRAYEESDRRQYYIPCPSCHHAQSLIGKFFKQVRWDSTLPDRESQARTARYHCEACDVGWDDAARWKAVDGGQWRADAPFAGVAGFWISELYSYQRQLWEIVLDFLTKKDTPGDYQGFINTTLAEPWNEPGEVVDWQRLVDRREHYPVDRVPAGGRFLTAGVDVQRADGGRLEVEVVAWGDNRESWSVCNRTFYGDPTSPEVWTYLEAMTHEAFPHEDGGFLEIERMFVDSGDGEVTPFVYEWVSQQRRLQVWAIKGARCDQPVGPPRAVESTLRGKKRAYGIVFRLVNVDYFKTQFYADLRKRNPTEDEQRQGLGYPQGYCHYPKAEEYGDEHFKQVCAEQLRRVKNSKGRWVTEYHLMRPRNEGLDKRVYAMAAAWDLKPTHRAQEQMPPPAAPPPRQWDDSGGWLGGRTQDWFRR